MNLRGKNELMMLALSLLLSFAASSCGQNSQANAKTEKTTGRPGLLGELFETTKPITIPEGTDLTVILDQTISTAESRSGDSFRATLISPIMIDGKTVIPKDAPVQGHIIESVSSGRLKGVARLDLTLDSVEVNGKSYEIDTRVEGRIGKNHNKRNGILIGGGTGLGALIGGIAGGGTGALIGGAVGAGAGTAGAAYTGKKDIRVPAETTLTFELARPVTIPVKS